MNLEVENNNVFKKEDHCWRVAHQYRKPWRNPELSKERIRVPLAESEKRTTKHSKH